MWPPSSTERTAGPCRLVAFLQGIAEGAIMEGKKPQSLNGIEAQKRLRNQAKPDEKKHVPENNQYKQSLQIAWIKWEKKLEKTLEELKAYSPDLTFDWLDHEIQFKKVPYQDSPSTVLSLTFVGIDIHPLHKWKKPSDSEKDKAIVAYESLAKRAANALGYQNGDEGKDALAAWHILLVLNSPHFHRTVDPGGWINSLCVASAEYCETCETEVYAMRRSEPGISWRVLELRFRALHQQDGGELRVEYDSRGFPSEPLYADSRWAFRDADNAREEFEWIAEKAVQKAKLGTSWQDWLNLIKRETGGYKLKPEEILWPENGIEVGSIKRVCEVSEKYCQKRADESGEPPLEIIAQTSQSLSNPEPASQPDQPLNSGDDMRIILQDHGDYWRIAYGSKEARLKDMKGVKYLAYLLQNPNKEIKAYALAAQFAIAGQRDYLKPINKSIKDTNDDYEHAELEDKPMQGVDEDLDEKAKKELREHLQKLSIERNNAEANHDPATIQRINSEAKQIEDRLKSGLGLFDRSRKFATPDERARKAVTNAINAAIKKICHYLPDLTSELKNIKTGDTCSYRADPSNSPAWEITLLSN
jgi:hypothetical protein